MVDVGEHLDACCRLLQTIVDPKRRVDAWRGELAAEVGDVRSQRPGERAARRFPPPAALPNAAAFLRFTPVTDGLTPAQAETGRLRVDARVEWSGEGPDRGVVTLTTLLADIR